MKHFDFIPQTFVLPGDYRELCSAHHRTRGPWIVKPIASSRGRGIYIVNNVSTITKTSEPPETETTLILSLQYKKLQICSVPVFIFKLVFKADYTVSPNPTVILGTSFFEVVAKELGTT